MRQYALGQLTADPEEAALARRFDCAYFAALLAGAEAGLKGVAQAEALLEIGARIEDIRQAWKWMVERRDLARLDSSIEALYQFYRIRAYFHACRQVFSEAATFLQSTSSSSPSPRSSLVERPRPEFYPGPVPIPPACPRAAALTRQAAFLNQLATTSPAAWPSTPSTPPAP